MAKAVAIVSALCILALSSIAHAKGPLVFNVEGNVYCDPCRVEFPTTLSKGIKGAEVDLKCTKIEIGSVTVQTQATTDEMGNYKLKVEGDHEEEICEITAKSFNPECNVPFDGGDRTRLILTVNNGVQGTDRYANPLGFKTKESDKQCKAVLDALGFYPLN